VVGGKVVAGAAVVVVVEEPKVVGRVVVDSAVVVVECPPKVTIAVIPSAATAAMTATMIIVRFRSVDLFAGSPSGIFQIVRRSGRWCFRVRRLAFLIVNCVTHDAAPRKSALPKL
jgi:hypothetical protein